MCPTKILINTYLVVFVGLTSAWVVQVKHKKTGTIKLHAYSIVITALLRATALRHSSMQYSSRIEGNHCLGPSV